MIASSYLEERNKVNPNQINLELHIIRPRFITFPFYGRQNIRFQNPEIPNKSLLYLQHKIVGPENIIESLDVFVVELKSKHISLIRHTLRTPDAGCKMRTLFMFCVMSSILPRTIASFISFRLHPRFKSGYFIFLPPVMLLRSQIIARRQGLSAELQTQTHNGAR